MIAYLRSIVPLAGTLMIALLVYACGGGDNGNGGTDPVTTGTIAATVTADGSPRAGTTVQLFAPGASSATATVNTGSNGVATFSNVEQGTWEVEVQVPTGFELDTGETQRKTVTVVASQTAATSFALVDVFAGTTIEATGSLEFSPSTVTIDAGTQVRWINVSTVLHTVTPDGHSEWTAATLADDGDTFIHTFNTPGTYEYYCEPHVGSNMRGTITVN
ncbi:MAG: plastocyanin/azurin family copper-binding protein [Longimicrobiales bacterium]|nr:plastocyanin/azurin family copper-binding protein [Longimicrobiales bacterium]